MLSASPPLTSTSDSVFRLHRTPRPLPAFNPIRPLSFTVRSSSSSSSLKLETTEELSSSEIRASSPFPPIKVAKRVVLVRHGQSTWNEEGRIQGSSDFSVLTRKGESQAETNRQMLINDAFDVCFSSPLKRSKRTAEVIWGSRNEKIITDYDLREIDLYSFQGLLKHEGKAKFGSAYIQWQKDAPNFNIDGHYPVSELWARARSCWTKILIHESKSILVVAHNAVNQALVATAMGLETEYFRYLLQSNCGVSVLDFIPRSNGGSPHVVLNRLNQTPGSPIMGGSSDGRKTSKQLILVCHGSSQNDLKASIYYDGDVSMNMLGIIQSQKTAELLLDLKLKTIVSSPSSASTETANAIARVQEAADCLGADSMPRYVETKKFQELGIGEIFQKSNQNPNVVPTSRLFSWLNGLDNESLNTLWDQSRKAWESLLEELSNESETENIVVAVAHQAVHIGLLGHCLGLTKERLGLFHLDAGSISIIDFPDGTAGGRGVVKCINYSAHLGRWAIPITKPSGDDEEV